MKVVCRMLATLVAAPALLLTSCGDDTESGGSSFPTPTLSPTPSATAPPKRETAEHFIRRWAAADKRMQNTGRTAEYLAISRRCAPCQRVARQVRGFYASGGFVRWDGWTIRSISRYAVDGKSLVMKVPIDSAPTTYKVSAQGTVKHLTGGTSVELLTVRRDGRSWQMIHTAELPS